MNVLTEAQTLIDGAREETYGRAITSFTRIGDLWSAYMGIEVSALDVTNLMILLKISRTKGAYHRDSYVDIAGYAGLGERLYDQEIEKWEYLLNEYGDPIEDWDNEGGAQADEDEDRFDWELGLAEARTQCQGGVE